MLASIHLRLDSGKGHPRTCSPCRPFCVGPLPLLSMVDGLLTIWSLAHVYPNLRRVSPITYTTITRDHTHLLRLIYPKAFSSPGRSHVVPCHIDIFVAAHSSILASVCLRGGIVSRGTPRIPPMARKGEYQTAGDRTRWNGPPSSFTGEQRHQAHPGFA